MKKLRPTIFIFFILFTVKFFGQNLHHQMLSSQGTSVQMSSGIYVNQTIGQQSAIGSYNNKKVSISQGYQQALWNVLINDLSSSSIITTTYPNPFFDTVNFRFSVKKFEMIKIEVYDILGRIVHQESKSTNNSVLSIDLPRLSDAEYLVKLQAPNYIHYTKIIKR